MKRILPVIIVLIIAIALIVIYYPAGEACPMEGNPKREELKALNKLKNRVVLPAAADFDTTVTLEKMLEPGDDHDRWSSSNAASVTGYVIKVKSGGPETCNCEAEDEAQHDTHIEIALSQHNRGKEGKVIVEVTPRMRELMEKQGIDWSTATLKKSLMNKQVKVQGWLLFDAQHEAESDNTAEGHKTWRSTAWEVHPVTSLQSVVE